jgi:predicted acylesterase/phospholipase RssA
MAVAASTALPILYKPVQIGDKEYVDGGLRGNASLDVAIEHGATLVICINPFVPYDNSDHASIPFVGEDGSHLSEKGMQAIASRASRITAHAGLQYHVKQVRAPPEVDIIIIEPRHNDYEMFFYNIMRYSTRLTVRGGFESVHSAWPKTMRTTKACWPATSHHAAAGHRATGENSRVRL